MNRHKPMNINRAIFRGKMQGARVLSLLLLSACGAFGQISPSTLTFTSYYHQMVAYFQDIAVTGSGTITVSNCTDTVNTGLCAIMKTNVQTANTVHIFWNGGDTYNNLASATNYAATITITLPGGTCSGGCTATINYHMLASPSPGVVNLVPPANNCSVGNTDYKWPEICTTTNARPGGTLNMPATLGAPYYNDLNFGGMRWLVGANGWIAKDATGSEINADGTMLIWYSKGANAYKLSKTDGSGDVVTLPGTIPVTGTLNWDPRNPKLFWYVKNSPGEIHKVTVPGLLDTPVVTYGGTGGLGCSNDCTITKDGYWPLEVDPHTIGNDTKVIMFNVFTGTIVATFDYGSITTLGSTTPGPSTGLRGIFNCSKGFSGVSGKMWCDLDSYQTSGGTNEFLSFTPVGGFVDEGPEAVSPESAWNNGGTGLFKRQPTTFGDCAHAICRGTGHSDWVEAPINGVKHEFWITPVSMNAVSRLFALAIDPDAGIANTEAVPEAGGGGYYLFPVNGNIGDYHLGGAVNAPAAVLDTDSDMNPGGPNYAVFAFRIVTIATGATTTVTYNSGDTAPANGQTLLMNGVVGIPELAGVNTACVVASLNTSAHTFVCSGLTTTMSYSSGGAATNNVAYNQSSFQTQSEILILDLTTIGTKSIKVTRLMKHRGVLFANDNNGAGYLSGQTTMSPDGTLECGVSNGGVPDNYSMYCGPTGYAGYGGDSALTNGVLSGKATLQ